LQRLRPQGRHQFRRVVEATDVREYGSKPVIGALYVRARFPEDDNEAVACGRELVEGLLRVPVTTTTNNNQTTTTTPSNTTQTVTTTPSVTPTIPTVSSVPALVTPSAPSQSTLDLLGEQMQASYQILGLRAILRGAQSDEYTADSQAMRHVTYGFPITVSTPHRYDNKAAEIEISVCNPKEVQQNIPPSLGLMLPQEKTYSVASMVSSSAGLGAGAVIAGVVNIGANFSWTHQTFYLVKQQDTVSLRKDRAEDLSLRQQRSSHDLCLAVPARVGPEDHRSRSAHDLCTAVLSTLKRS
jgi:hypothetical protein